MSESNSEFPIPGQICWLEVPCTDPDRAFAFYQEAFGWETSPHSKGPMPGYIDGMDSVHLFQKGNLSGAFVKLTSSSDVAAVADSASPAKMPILPSLVVEDIDKTAAIVEKHKGRVHIGKTPIAGGTMGHCARFIDTEGNIVAVWSAPDAKK